MNPMMIHIQALIRQREHNGVECRFLHSEFRHKRDGDWDKVTELKVQAYNLAMMSMQSRRYLDAPEYRYAIDSILSLLRDDIPSIIGGRWDR